MECEAFRGGVAVNISLDGVMRFWRHYVVPEVIGGIAFLKKVRNSFDADSCGFRSLKQEQRGMDNHIVTTA